MARSGQVVLFASTVGFLLQSAPAFASLVIRVEFSTREYAESRKFELSVILQNNGDAPVIVLPQSLRRQYRSLDAGIASYSPYPGPPIRPWKDAFLLRPGEGRTLTVRGMRDGDGVWNLEPGRYELSIRLSVTSDAVNSANATVLS